MESIPSPFYTDRGIGQAASALAQAFMPNPLREARLQGLTANAELDRARAGEIARRGAAGQAAGERLRAGSVDPGTLAQVFADVITSANPELMQALPGFIRGFGGAAGADPNRLAQLFVGAGGNYGATEPGFRYNVDTDAATARRGQDVSAGAQLDAERLRQAGADRRMAPEINPGNTVVVPPDSPLAGRAGPGGRIEGAPTFDAARAEAARRYAAGEGTPEERARWRDLFAPSIGAAEVRPGAAANRPPLDVSPQETQRLADNALALLGDTVGRDGSPNGANELTPEARAWVQRRAAALYQETRDAGTAAARAAEEFRQAYMRDFPGTPLRESAPGWFSSRTRAALPPSLRMGGPAGRDPGPSNLPPAPTEGAAPAAAPAQTQAVPPPAQRVIGQMYQTPRGPMIWTGTGWRPGA